MTGFYKYGGFLNMEENKEGHKEVQKENHDGKLPKGGTVEGGHLDSFVIFTDSASDIPISYLREWRVKCASLTFKFSSDEREYSNYDMEPEEFYSRMRKGEVAKTSAVNSEVFREAFEQELAEGRDILYLGFSSALSGTYSSAESATSSLRPRFPKRRVMLIDTLSASLGEGMLVYLAKKKRDAGAGIEEVYSYIRKLIPNLCHLFTVEDLVYLKRGGRVSGGAAFLGNMLGIKPILHMDDGGYLVPLSKVRGRRSSLLAMLERYTALRREEIGEVFISHGDSAADAELLGELIKERHGAEVSLMANVGPVIGAHAGPGVIALFFVAKGR